MLKDITGRISLSAEESLRIFFVRDLKKNALKIRRRGFCKDHRKNICRCIEGNLKTILKQFEREY